MKVTNKTRRRILAFALVFVLTLATGLVLASCDNDGSASNPFIGTWTGYDPDGYVLRVVVDGSSMTSSWPGNPQFGISTGTYTYSGNTATLFQYGVAIGTATVSGNTMTIVATGVGTMVLTR